MCSWALSPSLEKLMEGKGLGGDRVGPKGSAGLWWLQGKWLV